MKHLEDAFHKQINQYLTILQSQGKINTYTYNASGELRTKTTGSLLKAKGLKKGLPDYWIRKSNNNICYNIFLEAKVGKNKQTKEQIEFQDSTKDNCNEFYSVVRNIEDVQKEIEFALDVIEAG
jgi:hypothetical protein